VPLWRWAYDSPSGAVAVAGALGTQLGEGAGGFFLLGSRDRFAGMGPHVG